MKFATKIGLWGGWSVCAVGFLPASAQASSKFETGPSEQIEATVNLDFTIVIPHIVFLGRPIEDVDGPLTGPALSISAIKEPTKEAFIARSNAGTIVFAAAPERSVQSRDPVESEPKRALSSNRAYVVALP